MIASAGLAEVAAEEAFHRVWVVHERRMRSVAIRNAVSEMRRRRPLVRVVPQQVKAEPAILARHVGFIVEVLGGAVDAPVNFGLAF